MKGAWLWHELATPDVARSTDFYSRLFGWTAEQMPMEGPPYFIWNRSGQANGHGGMAQTDEGEAPRWLVYLETDDVDGDYARVVELGGKAITEIMDVPDVGRWFIAEDPGGAQFAIMTPYGPPADAVQAAPEPTPKAKTKAKPRAKPAAKAKAKSPKGKAKPATKPAKASAKTPARKGPVAPARSAKAKPMKAAIKAAKKTLGLRAGTKAKRDLAAAKARDASLKGRSQRNNKR